MSGITHNASARLDLPIGAIAVPADGLRAARPEDEADAGFARCVAALGVLQPILVRAGETPDTYRLVAGRRRLRAAIAAGHTSIPAVFRPDLSDADAAAIELAENVQRRAMAPLDQWRAIARLRALGWQDQQHIADALGLPLRLLQRMQKLGDLHPTILAAIEQHGMPQDRFLTTIAAASAEAQARAMARETHFSDACWWRVAEGCRVARIPRDRAIFDLAAVPIAWDEDLFAEPGAADQFTTTDIAGFVAAQRAALEAKAAASKGKLAVVKPDKNGRLAVPKGWTETWGWQFGDAKWPRGAVGYAMVDAHGRIVSQAAKPPAKPGEKKAAAPVDDGDDEEADGGGHRGDDDILAPPPPPEAKRLTEKGRILLAELKTDALRATLRDRPAPEAYDLLVLLLLALAGKNVTIRGEHGAYGGAITRFDDIAAVAYALREGDEMRVRRLAAEALARMLRCGPVEQRINNEHSGAAAEWIGEILQAERALPRLDREDLLKAASADALDDAARAAGVVPKGTAKATRALIVGQAEHVILFDEARFRAKPPRLDVPEIAEPGTVCGRKAGNESCPCGWHAADGEDASACEEGEWRAQLARLGLVPEDVTLHEDGFGVISPRGPLRPAPAPEDHAAQRRADAAAFDGKPAGAFDCAWNGAAVCGEDGTTRCLQQCPRHEKYAAWITSPAGKRARRAKENADAKASLRAPRRRKEGDAA